MIRSPLMFWALLLGLVSCSAEPSGENGRVSLTSQSGAAVELEIPPRFFGSAGGERLELPTYRFHITLLDMKGMFEEENQDIPSCSGYCNGFASAWLSIAENAQSFQNSRLSSFLTNSEIYRLERSGPYSSTHEEYDVFWHEYPRHALSAEGSDGEGGDGAPSVATASQVPAGALPVPVFPEVAALEYDSHERAEIAYRERPWPIAHMVVFRDRPGVVDIVECSKALKQGELEQIFEFHSCKYEFRSTVDERLEVDFHFKYQDLSRWPELRDEIIALIDSFVVD